MLALLAGLAPSAGQAQGGSAAADKLALEALHDATSGARWTTATHWKSAEPLGSWHGVTTDADGRVTGLALGGNGLKGTLPAALGDLDALEALDLSNNALTGALPDELANLTALRTLNLSKSWGLEGPLPGGLRLLANLQTVSIANTELCAPGDSDFRAWTATISFSGLRCPPDADSTIDLAVFYTPAARDEQGGTTAIRDKIDVMVAWTNTAYRTSGVKQRLNLVAVEQIEYVEQTEYGDLARLHKKSDGYLDEVHAVRDREAADVVYLIRSTAGINNLGVALLMTNPSPGFESGAFGVGIASGGVLAHELGHVMGLHHDRWSLCGGKDCEPGMSLPYAYGYIHCKGTVNRRWRTIMAILERCPNYYPSTVFSNPDLIHRGHPAGVAGVAPSTSVDGPADGARALNRTRAYVSEFRQAPDVTVSFAAAAYAATEGGSAAVAVRLSAAPTRPIAVPLVATPGTGLSHHDYRVPTSVRFGASDTEQTVTVTAVDDAVDEDDETLLLTLGAQVRGVTLGTLSQTTVTLKDNDTVTGAPSVVSVEVASMPGAAGVYVIGDAIDARVRFNKAVTVTGQPQLALAVGSGSRRAAYAGTDGELVRFAYTVAEGDKDGDGVGIAANSLALNGGMIRDGGGQDAALTHAALADDPAQPIDGIRPALDSAEANAKKLYLTFDKALDEASVPSSGDFQVTVDGNALTVAGVAVRGSVATLTLGAAIAYGEDGAKVSHTPGTPPLRNRVGNAAAAFADAAVTTDPPRHDSDVDGLIDVANLTQLDAVRHDLDGDGVPSAAGAAAHAAAFPGAPRPLRCKGGCRGYALTADLDFKAAGRWVSGQGWPPIGAPSAPFNATFDGKGRRISNLRINRPSSAVVALFGATGRQAVIRAVGLPNVDVVGSGNAAALVGPNVGTVRTSWATGRVQGRDAGGLVAVNGGTIKASWAAVRVVGTGRTGGLVGSAADGSITASYATGWVSGAAGSDSVGGLVGRNVGWLVGSGAVGTIRASYATARVTGGTAPGGLVGSSNGDWIQDSYWDTETSGTAASAGGAGKSTSELQAPTDYTGIYNDWWVGGFGGWHFGTANEYPVPEGDGGYLTWRSIGHQLRAGPRLTVTPELGAMRLSWSAVDVSVWSSPPPVAYTVIRSDGATVAAIASGLGALAFTDRNVTQGNIYTYQVATEVDGGIAALSAVREATAAQQATAVGANNAATGQPAISGTAQEGRTLTAGPGTITDADGLANAAYAYQWIWVDGASEIDISGAGQPDYVVQTADVGGRLKVRAFFSDDAGNAEQRTSAATATVTANDPGDNRNPPVDNPPTTGGGGGGGGGGGRGVCDRVDLVVENLEVEEPEEKTSIRVRLPNREPPFDTSTIIRCAAVSIKYTTEDGSALSGKDYETSSGEIELLGAGGRTEGYGEAILEIPIVDDPLYEQDEAFTLKLEVDPSDNRGWSRSNLPIVDDDGYVITIHSDDPPSSYIPAEPQPAWEYVE